MNELFEILDELYEIEIQMESMRENLKDTIERLDNASVESLRWERKERNEKRTIRADVE